MKGFIEVTPENNREKYLIPLSGILRVTNCKPTLIITNELVSRFECSNDNLSVFVQESYEEIKALIKSATEV